MEQMTLDLFGPFAVPTTCGHRRWHDDIGKAFCELHGSWTNCGAFEWGETVGCVYEEPDNSPEARRRRIAWLRDHGGKAS